MLATQWFGDDDLPIQSSRRRPAADSAEAQHLALAAAYERLFDRALGGIFSGMNSHPGPDEVLADLGDKFVQAFLEAMGVTRDDLQDFRGWRSSWFPTFTERFLGNFIHERMWAEMVQRVDDLPGLQIVDKEPRREIECHGRYTVRFKRHRPGDKIATYATEGALAYWTNRVTLPGLELVSLAMGYLWDAELRQIGDTVLSFRDGKDNPLWAITLNPPVAGTAGITWNSIDPQLPSIDLSDILDETGEEDGEATGS
ncbi:hypothetical protein [Kineococcus sp. R86509]|uniref:hypothetical protein n=1 Tax=Kineococcus sp. R86509 TaxID=3093851 RepID=UPI0036D30BC5